MNPRASLLVTAFAIAIVAAVAAVLLTLAVVDRRSATPTPRPTSGSGYPNFQPRASTANPDAEWIEGLNDMATSQAESRERERERQQDRELCELKRELGEYTVCFP